MKIDKRYICSPNVSEKIFSHCLKKKKKCNRCKYGNGYDDCIFTERPYEWQKDYLKDSYTGQEAFDLLVYHFMGEDHYITDHINSDRGNAIIIKEILDRYPRGAFKKIGR